MYLKSSLLFIYVETPLHAGAGAGLGAVDLPIQRERPTGYPMVQASGLKGALRSEASGTAQEISAVFGPDTTKEKDAELHAGALAMSDARILLFPVRSLKGVFAWTTSLDALQRWHREATMAGIANLPTLPAEPPTSARADETPCYVSGNGATVDGQVGQEKVKQVVLEEFTYTVRQSDVVAKQVKDLADWLAKCALPTGLSDYWRNGLRAKLVILPDEEFRDFLMHATEILTRIRLETDSKTVQQGALWTEEHLPTDSLLYAPAHATRLRVNGDRVPAAWKGLEPAQQATAVLKWVSEKIPARLQLGGDETVGRGIVSLRWMGGA